MTKGNNRTNEEMIDIFDEEESNIHLTQLKGKIVRSGDCPLNKFILCEDCEFYDGWGVDYVDYEVHVYCNNPNIIDSAKLSLIPEVNIEKRKYFRWRKNKKKVN